jgi:hypothetical protein
MASGSGMPHDFIVASLGAHALQISLLQFVTIAVIIRPFGYMAGS